MLIEPKRYPWTDEDIAEFKRWEDQCATLCDEIFPEKVAQEEAATIINFYNSQRLAGEDPKRVLDRFYLKLTRLSESRTPRKRSHK